ncbi:MAG: Cof-type HAD-IIB family hydrolase [Saprospiraceae bacterium]
MTYKLVCSDIDGTLLNKDRELSRKTIEIVKQIKENHPVILISSRMPKAMTHLQNEMDILDHPLIAYNGGLVLTNDNGKNKMILSIEISIELAYQILTFISNSTIHMSLYNSDKWYVPEMDYWAKREMNNTKIQPEVAQLKQICMDWKNQNIGPHKIMCMGEKGEIQLLENYLRMHFSNELNIYRSKDTYLEIASKKISKLSALSFLLEKKYDISLQEVIAFGDNYNDIEMLEGVGLGVAVGNAKKEVKQVADQITLSNLEDGVAHTLAEIFSKK